MEDIKLAMNALKELRDNEIRIDMCILPIEEIYKMLQRHHIEVPKEEIKKCETLRQNYLKLMQMSSQRASYLLDLQPRYKDELKHNLDAFSKKCDTYCVEYKNVSY